jgi:hypothetical protein
MKAVIISKFRSTVTLGLMLWCAGAGCMIVSVAQGANRDGTGTGAVNSGSSKWSQASGSMGTHDCCKARHAAERRAGSSMTLPAGEFEEVSEVPASSNAMSCCPLTSGTFVVSGRQRVGSQDAAAPRYFAPVSIVSSVAAPALVISPRLPDQNETYLRDCVFLI